MIVADSSVLIRYFSKEDGWEEAEKIIEQGVMTFDLAVKEIANALWKKVLREEMAEKDAVKIISDLEDGEVIRLENQAGYIEEAFHIAIRRRIPIYDALFISLAKNKRLELVTCDKKQSEAAEEEGVRVWYLP